MFASFFNRSLVSKMMVTLLVASLLSPSALAFSTDFTVDAGPAQSTMVDATVAVNSAVTGADTDALAVSSIDWGDGSSDTAVITNLGGGILNLGGTHSYSDAGTYTVTVTADDDGSGTLSDTLEVTVSEPTPTYTVEAGDDQTVALGTAVTINASTSDDSDVSGVTATVDWGDTTSESMTYVEGDAFTGTHTYSLAGTYMVMVTFTEDLFVATDMVVVTVTDSSLPDLKIDEIMYDNGSDAFLVTISNQGTADLTTDANLFFSFDYENDINGGEDPSSSFYSTTYSLAPYGTDYFPVDGSATYSTSSEFTVDTTTCVAYVLVVIDPANDIEEISDADLTEDNYYRATVDLCPDLTVNNMTITQDETDPTLYRVAVDFLNLNNVGVDSGLGGSNETYINGSGIGSYNWDLMTDTSFLTPYGELLGQNPFSGLVALMDGDVIEVCIDGGDVAYESDESNNCVSTTFATVRSDLTVNSVTVDDSDYSLDISISNIGVGDVDVDANPTMTLVTEIPGSEASPALPFDLEEYVTEGADFRVAGSTMIVSLSAGDAEAFVDYCESVESVEESTWTFTVYVDAGFTVLEEDESNNEYVTTFDICEGVEPEPQADLDILDIIVDESTGALSYVAANLGDLDVDYAADVYGDTRIYIDSEEAADYTYLWVDEVNAGNWTGAFFFAGGTETIDSGVILEPGTHTVMVCIYPAVYFGETAYGLENCETETVTVSSASTGSSSGGGLPTGGSSSGGNGGGSSSSSSNNSNNNDEEEDVVLTGDDEEVSEDVELTEDEMESCGEMTFVDVPNSHPLYDSIYRMWCEGVIHGRDAQHFAPDEMIKRDEAAKVIARLFGFVTVDHSELPWVTVTSYSDLATDEPLAYYVETLTDEGLYEDEVEEGTFRPHEDMSYAEIVDILEAVSEQEVSLEGYSDDDGMDRAAFMDLVFSLFE